MTTISNNILAKLLALGVRFRAKMKETIDMVNAPEIIKNAIHVGSPQAFDGGGSIEITIPLREAPPAAAFEWGSGLRSEGAEGEEYIIEANSPEGLMFPREDWPNYEPPPNAPRVWKFPFVMHPGVEARPYIRPSIEYVMPEARRILGEAILAEISITGNKERDVVEIKG